MSWGSSGLAWADALSAPNTVTAYIDHVPDQGDGAADRLQPRIAAAIVDVFVYVVVLNLFVEYLPQVISETFTLSLLTAVLLKGVLEIVVAAKNRGQGAVPPSLHADGQGGGRGPAVG